VAWWGVLSAAIAPALLIGGWTVAAALQPSSFDAMTRTVSSLAALGATDQHSQVQLYLEGPNDKVFTFWAVKRFHATGQIPDAHTGLAAFDSLAGQSLAKLIDAERRSTAAAMVEYHRPNCTVTLDRVDEEHLGAFLQMMEFQTAFMGEFLNINAFNQEGVELGKKLTFGLMGRDGYESYRAQFAAYEKKRAAAR